MFKLASNGARLIASSIQRSSKVIGKPVTGGFNGSRTYYPLMSNYNLTKSVERDHLMRKCACGCGTIANSVHTKGDKELVNFLTEEIVAEQKAQTNEKLPDIEGFEVATDGASITLTRKSENQNVKVSINVNHSVDADISEEEEVNPNQDKVNLSEMRSKPGFTVDIEQPGGRTLSFTCTIINEEPSPEEEADPEAFNDAFNIEEVSIFDGKREESTYAVSGDIMDGYLYDLLMNFLEERGISNEFANKLADYCTAYEHKLYIGLLENIKAFASK